MMAPPCRWLVGTTGPLPGHDSLAFVALATPQIVLLSLAKGRVTFSDTGKLAYAWYNYGLPLRNWQGQPAGSGTPVHPTRKLYEHPAVYEFNGPIRSSYPPWYDPSYWNEGLSPHFQLGTVARHVVHDTVELGANFLHPSACDLPPAFVHVRIRQLSSVPSPV